MFLLPKKSICPVSTFKSDPSFKTQIKSHLLQDTFRPTSAGILFPTFTQYFCFSSIALTSSSAISDLNL